MKKYLIITLLTVAVGFTGCLKDNKTNLTPDNSPAVVEFSTAVTADVPISPSGSTYPLYLRSFAIVPSVPLNFEVNYTGGDAAPQDITVNLAVDNTLITKYNQERADRDHQTSIIEAIPAAWYTIPTSVVIKKGDRKATVVGTAAPSNITDFAKQYALALKITSVSSGSVSGNYSAIIVRIGAKNDYDGVYNYKSSSIQTLRPSINEDGAELTTLDKVTVSSHLVNYYSNVVKYAVDPATNKATVVSSGLAAAAVTDPSSNWDPAKKVLYLKWKAGTRTFEETYTYTKPRS